MARTEHTIVVDQYSKILLLTIGAATNVTGEVVVCVINLF